MVTVFVLGEWEFVGAAGWTTRNGFPSSVLTDGSVVVLGGYGSGYSSDVWKTGT